MDSLFSQAGEFITTLSLPKIAGIDRVVEREDNSAFKPNRAQFLVFLSRDTRSKRVASPAISTQY